jgi:putative Mn2+ efflux pump MntP
MSLPASQVLLTSLALAMDCTAIAVAYGLSGGGRRGRGEVRLALSFGACQALLFLLGYAAGRGFRGMLADWDHWIAFGLLAGIGGKMLWESFAGEGEGRVWDLTGTRILLLSLAASIDALAVGLGFSLMGEAPAFPALVVGAGSVLLPLLGYYSSSRAGRGLGAWAERFGGLVLLGIGVRILIQHLLQDI